MRTLALMSAVVCLTFSGMAQSIPTQREALKDAEYALRRFDEVTARIDFTRWKAPGPVVGHEQEALQVTRATYVSEAKTMLANFDGKRQPTSADLLVIMYDVQNVGMELDNLSDAATNFQDPDTLDTAKLTERGSLVDDLVGAGIKAQAAAAKIFVILKPQVEAEEDLLRRCLQTPTTEKKVGASK
jgi:hypothetical protein